MKITSILSFLFLICLSANAQKNVPDIHVLELRDKVGSPYSIHRPWEFLSPRALERRKKSGIAVDESDLPISPVYIQKIQADGIPILSQSKWMNSLTVRANAEELEKIKQWDFVANTFPVGKYRDTRTKHTPPEIERGEYPISDDYYGEATTQIMMLGGHVLHAMGNEGEGMLVAVMDGGFKNADVMPFFDSLRARGNWLPGRDFVHNDDYPYEDSGHGTQVLSTMAANLPGLMVGTGPQASYICIKTEEIGSENPVEEEYWLAGAEYADSLGADIINSSLGYTGFDLKELNHTREDLDGRTARMSRGVDIAASKGILVLNSAGNEGRGGWQKIGVPSDAFDVLSVGAVDAYGNKASFSSFGPTSDGRIKPEVAAMGQFTAVAKLNGYKVGYSNGTSFSSPVMAGMASSLWSAYPERSWDEVREAIISSGSQHFAPDTLLGNGIPDFTAAAAWLSGVPRHHRFDRGTRVFRQGKDLEVIFSRSEERLSGYILYNSLGEKIKEDKQIQNGSIGAIRLEDFTELPAGVYNLFIYTGDSYYRLHLVRESGERHRP